MPTARFYITNASNGTLARYPSSSSALTILSNTSTNSYVYLNNGSSTDPVYGTLALSFGRNQIQNKIGSNGIINECTFGMVCATFDSPYFYQNKGELTFNNKILISAINPDSEGTISTVTKLIKNNPITNNSWQPKDFDEDIILSIEVNGQYGYRVYYIYVDISYINHEIQRPIKGKIKTNTSKGIIEIPYFNILDIMYPALRIKTDKGIFTFCLVDTTDPYASPIRIKTPKGIKAIGYIK